MSWLPQTPMPPRLIVAASYETSAGSKQGNFVVQRSGEKRFAIYPRGAWWLRQPS